MFDFRLQVFHTVATRLNFTKAAEELFITQPAVTKHIKEIENYFKVKLFDRNGTKINLTPAGEILFQHTTKIFSLHNELEFEMNNIAKRQKGKLKIGASTTVAQYVLPPVLAAFHKKFKDIKVALVINNTEQIEYLLQDGKIDLGIVEGESKKVGIKYTECLKDEIVLVTTKNNSLFNKQTISPEDLKKIPLLLREPGSGTLEVVAHALKKFGIKISQLQNEMQLSSTESIKLYLLNSNCLAFLSKQSISKEIKNNELKIIDIKGLKINRSFYFIQLQGEVESLSNLFMNFCHHYNFKL